MTGAAFPEMGTVEAIQTDRDAAAEAERGAIRAARALADRECGATQAEMQQAREEYLVKAFARHRVAVIEAMRECAPEMSPIIEEAIENSLLGDQIWEAAIDAVLSNARGVTP